LPIVAYGLLRRLNDWAPEVRRAANAAALRCFAVTDEAILLPAVWLLLPHAKTWGRWGRNGMDDGRIDTPPDHPRVPDAGYATFVEMVMGHPGLVTALVNRLCQSRKGGTSQVFWALSPHPAFDRFLMQIAQQAQQPHLRAAATNSLIAGNITWPLSTKRKVWVDKSMGAYNLETEFGSRPLSIVIDVESVLRRGFADRSTMVKRQAFDGLTARRHSPELQSLIADCLADFADCPVPVLRSRRDYLAKVMARGG
jgi:hypothetical protein